MALEWFNGNADAEHLYQMLVHIAHTWDDLIDKDKEVADADINKAFMYALVSIPMNPVFVAYREHLVPLLYAGVLGFLTATAMEKRNDPHMLEIAYGLRYAVAHVCVFMVCLFNPFEKALSILPDVWKRMMPERWDDYAKEHGYVEAFERPSAVTH